jgi:hypothetical protein
MRRLAYALAFAALAGCASVDPVPAVSKAEIVELARAGADAQWIIDRLAETGTLLQLSASDIIEMHQAGVPPEVLEWMQAAHLQEMLRRQAMFDQMYYGRPFGRCAWPPQYGFHPRFGWRVRPWPGC